MATPTNTELPPAVAAICKLIAEVADKSEDEFKEQDMMALVQVPFLLRSRNVDVINATLDAVIKLCHSRSSHVEKMAIAVEDPEKYTYEVTSALLLNTTTTTASETMESATSAFSSSSSSESPRPSDLIPSLAYLLSAYHQPQSNTPDLSVTTAAETGIIILPSSSSSLLPPVPTLGKLFHFISCLVKDTPTAFLALVDDPVSLGTHLCKCLQMVCDMKIIKEASSNTNESSTATTTPSPPSSSPSSSSNPYCVDDPFEQGIDLLDELWQRLPHAHPFMSQYWGKLSLPPLLAGLKLSSTVAHNTYHSSIAGAGATESLSSSLSSSLLLPNSAIVSSSLILRTLLNMLEIEKNTPPPAAAAASATTTTPSPSNTFVLTNQILPALASSYVSLLTYMPTDDLTSVSIIKGCSFFAKKNPPQCVDLLLDAGIVHVLATRWLSVVVPPATTSSTSNTDKNSSSVGGGSTSTTTTTDTDTFAVRRKREAFNAAVELLGHILHAGPKQSIALLTSTTSSIVTASSSSSLLMTAIINILKQPCSEQGIFRKAMQKLSAGSAAAASPTTTAVIKASTPTVMFSSGTASAIPVSSIAAAAGSTTTTSGASSGSGSSSGLATPTTGASAWAAFRKKDTASSGAAISASSSSSSASSEIPASANDTLHALSNWDARMHILTGLASACLLSSSSSQLQQHKSVGSDNSSTTNIPATAQEDHQQQQQRLIDILQTATTTTTTTTTKEGDEGSTTSTFRDALLAALEDASPPLSGASARPLPLLLRHLLVVTKEVFKTKSNVSGSSSSTHSFASAEKQQQQQLRTVLERVSSRLDATTITTPSSTPATTTTSRGMGLFADEKVPHTTAVLRDLIEQCKISSL